MRADQAVGSGDSARQQSPLGQYSEALGRVRPAGTDDYEDSRNPKQRDDLFGEKGSRCYVQRQRRGG